MVQGGDRANPGTCRDIPPKPGMRILWPLFRTGRSRRCTSPVRRIHACPHRPDPRGGAWGALFTSGGSTHKLAALLNGKPVLEHVLEAVETANLRWHLVCPKRRNVRHGRVYCAWR